MKEKRFWEPPRGPLSRVNGSTEQETQQNPGTVTTLHPYCPKWWPFLVLWPACPVNFLQLNDFCYLGANSWLAESLSGPCREFLLTLTRHRPPYPVTQPQYIEGGNKAHKMNTAHLYSLLNVGLHSDFGSFSSTVLFLLQGPILKTALFRFYLNLICLNLNSHLRLVACGYRIQQGIYGE